MSGYKQINPSPAGRRQASSAENGNKHGIWRGRKINCVRGVDQQEQAQLPCSRYAKWAFLIIIPLPTILNKIHDKKITANKKGRLYKRPFLQ